MSGPYALWRNARLATLRPGTPWGLIERGALLTRGAGIAWVGAEVDLAANLPIEAEHDLAGALVTPGLVDCHTHLVYGGRRADEFELRLQGASYEQIARAGGGIRSTVAATRAAGNAALLDTALARARTLAAGGVTTLEVKSGYGLTLEDEARCLAAARGAGAALGIEVRTTFLGAHALPPEFDGRADDYIDAVCRWLPALHAEGLVDAVDAFCERIGFTAAQTQRVFEAARALGIPVKLHADQLSDGGGAALVAAFDGLSADHVEYTSEAGVAALKQAGSVAVLLPGAFHVLRETKLPPLDAFRARGVPMAVATDCNPGTSPLQSLRLAMSLACTHFRLTPEEALRGATVHAARALGLEDRGRLVVGQRADFVRWRIGQPAQLAYWLGGDLMSAVHAGGRVIVGA